MIHYRIDVADAHAHQYRVTLTVAQPAATQVFSLPVWIPGSYLVREFGRHLSQIEARQGSATRPVQQLDKATWQVATEGQAALVLTYLVYAFDTSVRAAFLNTERGFFNGTGVFLRVHGREGEAHQVRVGTLPKGWEVATAMPALKVKPGGVGDYQAQDYDEVADQPFELGRFWRGSFTAGGVPHDFVVAGALPSFDGDRLLADTQRICETEIAFWHGKPKRSGKRAAPFDRYVFMLNAVEEGYGGLEHRASTALQANRRDLPRQGDSSTPDGYANLLGLISHEYFHTWNVKRLRPAEFASFDYTQENYTELLWFFEGFTSYYDDLFLVRSGLIDEARYLRLISKTLQGVAAVPGRLVQSVAQASFDAWVKHYRPDENTPNATISYYTKGSLVGLAFDLKLRLESGGERSLDDVMRGLWQRSQGGPISEADIATVLAEVGGRSYAPELAAWVHGTGDLPLTTLLAQMGIEPSGDVAQQPLAARLGLKLSEGPVSGCQVKQVLRGSAAEQAGLCPGDELLAVNGWRIRRLDDANQWLTPGAAFEMLLVRDQRIHTLAVTPPATQPIDQVFDPRMSLRLSGKADTTALRKAWLAA